jgi:rhamnosyltransferase
LTGRCLLNNIILLPTISVIIPVKNGACTLGRCLTSIRNQVGIGLLEIIIIDSNSSDQSATIAQEYGARILSIPPQEFNHGLTRNIGVDFASGDLLFFTVQDAWLSEPNLLQKMSSHFFNSEFMGVVGHQAVPHELDKNPILWFKRFTEPRTQYRKLQNRNDLETLTNVEKAELIAWDNVVAMYRKSALQDLPFTNTRFAEDWIWSRDALLKGYTLVYDPSSVVYHYHHLDYDYAYRLQFTVNYHFYKHFGFKPLKTELLYPIIRASYHLIRHRFLKFSEKLFWMKYNIAAYVACYKSTKRFNTILHNDGLIGIEIFHKQICNEIPQGKQRKNL